MGYELLEFGRPPDDARASGPPAGGTFDVQGLDHEWLSPRPSAPGTSAPSPHRRRILIAGAVGALAIGLAVAWTAQGSAGPPPAGRPILAQPVRPVVALGSGLTSQLTGPAYAPMLLLHNGTPQPLQVGVGPGTSNLSLASDPALPVVIFAGQAIAVLLRVQTSGCSTDPAPSGSSSLQLVGGPVPIPGGSTAFGATQVTTIDLTAVVAYDRRQACR